MKKLFTNDKFYFISTLLAVIFGIAFSVEEYINENEMYCIPCFLSAVFALILYLSYWKHSKNVMKGMMGALISYRLVEAAIILMSGSIHPIWAILSFIFVLGLFINHFVINSDHHSQPVMIRINQILSILIAIVNIIWTFSYMPNVVSFMDVYYWVTSVIAYSALCIVIVCVESRLDAYRLDREAAGWTEERGYPEGYIHEYEKK